jgi:hypothetical protein
MDTTTANVSASAAAVHVEAPKFVLYGVALPLKRTEVGITTGLKLKEAWVDKVGTEVSRRPPGAIRFTKNRN